MHLKFKAFRAVNDLDLCFRFVEGHRNVLRDYGITNITSNNEIWMHNPNVYCVVAESLTDHQIVGGVRIQVSDLNTRLPVEQAIGRLDAAIHRVVDNFRNNGGIGELCALWNAKSVAGLGISMLLIRSGVAIASQLAICSLISICADYTLKMFQKVGFVVDYTLGTNGIFAYPNENYTARVLGIVDSNALDTAEEFDKARIGSLRNEPVQTIMEQGAGGQIKIDYNLIISK